MMSAASWRDGRRVLWIAIALGLILRAAVLLNTRGLGAEIGDERDYVRLASNILHSQTFAVVPGRPTSLRPPLYPALVASIWWLTGDGNLQAVRFAQIFLALLATVLVYDLGRRAFNPAVGRYAAAVFWLYPSLIFFNFTILTEGLFTILLLAVVLLAVRLVQAPRALPAVACGVALGLAALTRSVLWPLPVVLCPLVAVLLRASTKQRILLPTLLFAGYAVVVTPWAIRNTRLQGVLEIVDTMGGLNLRMGNYEYTPNDRMWDAVGLTGDKSWVHGLDVPGVPTEGQKDKWAQRKAIEYIKANPGTTFRRSFIKFADFWGLEREFAAGVSQGLFAPPFWLATIASAVIVLVYAGVTLLGASGLWMVPPADRRIHILMLLPIFAIMGAHTIVFGHSRYHIPLVPILGIYACACVYGWRDIDWRRHRLAATGAAITIGILATIWIRQIVLTDLRRIEGFFSGRS
jgi:4-amino-4-deoxy-L-arabinose transferase-like glycosyltransferase